MSYSLKALVGGTLYDLPHYQSAQLGYEFSDVSGLVLKYLKGGVNYDRLVEDAVVIAYWNGVEPFDSRWWIQAGDGNDEPEDNAFSVTGKSLLDIFRRVVVLPATGQPAGSTVKFNAATAGGILVNLFTAAQAAGRGAMTGITWNFSATVDSAGVAWDKVITLEYKPGLKYIDVIRNLVDQGMIEVRFNGTQFQAFIGDKMGSDLSVAGASQVELVAGRDYTELPSKWSTEERAKYAYVIGDENAIIARTSAATATGPFGREEIGLSQGGTKDVGTLTIVGDAALERVAEKRREYTRKVKIRSDGKVPSVDYRVSDYILERVNDLPERYRVRSMVLDVSPDGTIGDASIVLNDRFLEQEIRQARRVNGIIGGASVDGGGNGVPVAEKPDTTTPNAPTSLLLSTAAYTDVAGWTRSLVTAQWTAPTLNTDGSAISDLKEYEVNWKKKTLTDWNPIAGTTGTQISFSNLEPSTIYQVRVRAKDNSIHSSAWSATSEITTANDTAPPLVPSTPTVVNGLKVITLVWDGKGDAGGTMPIDYKYTKVHMSTVNNFTPSAATLHGVMDGLSRYPVTNVNYDTDYFFKLVSVDLAGNESNPSVQVTGRVSKLVSFDFASGSVGFDQLAFKQVGNLAPDGSFEDATYRQAMLSAGMATGFSFQGSGGFLGSWSMTVNSTISPSTYRLQKLIPDPVPSATNLNPAGWVRVEPGQRFLVRAMVKRTSDGNGFLNLGLTCYTAAGARVTSGGATTPALKINYNDPGIGTAWTEVSAVREVQPGCVWMSPIVENGDTSSTGSWEVDIVEVRPIVETALIDDAAITRAKIVDLAVNDAKIESVNVGKLTAGTMTADLTTSAKIQTAASGVRVVLDAAGGLRSIRSDGSINVQILNSSEDPALIHDGLVMGTNAAIRFSGGTAGGYMHKDPDDKAIHLRSTGGLGSGAGASWYENSRTGNDFQGHPYSGALHLDSGGSATLKLLNDQSAYFNGMIEAPSMRPVAAAGGSTTGANNPAVWGTLISGPVAFFTAPPSGTVRVDLNTSLACSTTGTTVKADVQCRNGTTDGAGVDQYTPTGVIVHGGTTIAVRRSGWRIISGLTPGVSYYCRAVVQAGDSGVYTSMGFSSIVVTPFV